MTSSTHHASDFLQLRDAAPAPLPRAVLYGTLALLSASFLWAYFAPLDIIAVAPGKIVPQGYLQIVQPTESGVIKEILVTEGAQVKAGQILARMDARVSDADGRQLQNELRLKRLQLRRIDAELGGAPWKRVADDPAELFAQVEAQLNARRQAHFGALEIERAILVKAEQDLKSAQEVEAKLQKTIPLYIQREAAYDQLVKDGFAGTLMHLERQRDRIEKEQDLRAQQFNIASLKATISQVGKRIAQITSSYHQQLQNERIDAEAQYHRLQQDWEKQAHRHALLELKAPQDGIVKDLATHTLGSVVAPGTVVMTLVPDGDALLAEVWVTHLDAGLVEPGQTAKLKLTAYPFQQYGMLDARVRHISPDASEASDQKSAKNAGLQDQSASSFRALIELPQPFVQAQGKRYRLSPGMQVNAEINLGTRTVLQYLLAPVQRTLHEAGRER
ncbi:MAG: HlyD family type I secretion periplasmic adaptor subunit [Proteobacteria bacterium]|nr:HlyD family type I secretion periplasmic adaptor subunit [Pseudomonadota bacterium]